MGFIGMCTEDQFESWRARPRPPVKSGDKWDPQTRSLGTSVRALMVGTGVTRGNTVPIITRAKFSSFQYYLLSCNRLMCAVAD